MTGPVVVTEDEVRRRVTMPAAISAVRDALVATAEGQVENPHPWHLDLTGHDGELHVKGAYLFGAETFTVKAASGFPRNADRGQPTSDGFVAVFDAATGRVAALLLDGGYLTELRTGAAGAVATDALASPDVEVAAVVGAGAQARFQIEGLLCVRKPRVLIVAARRRDRAESLAAWARHLADWEVRATDDLQEAVREADVVHTVTGSRAPVLLPGWLRPGAHVTAVGSDSPGKRELHPQLLVEAALVAADDVDQSRLLGELQGIEITTLQTLPVPLGRLLATNPPRMAAASELWSVADLTGLGAEDAAVAELAVAEL